jgi:hypothetical protein
MIFIGCTLLVPVLLALGVLISPMWPIKEKINQKKFAVLIGASTVVSAMVCCGLYFGAISKLYFKEVWNYKITSIKHTEKWTTHETRQERYQSGTDSKGNPTYSYRTVHYTETHGPYWHKFDEYGKRISIGSGEYRQWAKFWANEKHIGTNRGSSHAGRAITGEIYSCKWPGQFENIFPHSSIHKYVNKARVSKNTINQLPKPTEAQKKKYPRPVDNDNTSPIISYGPTFSKSDIMLMRRTNAVLGPKKDREIHAMIVAFHAKNGRRQIKEVLTAWEGTNKNELIMFVGLDAERKVEWCEVRNWLDLGNSTVNNMWRDAVMGEVFDVPHAAKVLKEIVPKHWTRPQAKTINHLQISIHWGWGVAAFLSTLAITAGFYFLVEYKIFATTGRYGRYRY